MAALSTRRTTQAHLAAKPEAPANVVAAGPVPDKVRVRIGLGVGSEDVVGAGLA